MENEGNDEKKIKKLQLEAINYRINANKNSLSIDKGEIMLNLLNKKKNNGAPNGACRRHDEYGFCGRKSDSTGK